MHMKVKIKGYSALDGSPEAIVKLMHNARMIPTPDNYGYIETITKEVKEKLGIEINVTGETYHDRVVSFLHEMDKYGMITIEEEDN